MRFVTLLILLVVGFFAPSALTTTAAPIPKPGLPRVLVVSSNKDGNWDVYLVQAGTGEVKNLTNHKATDTDPIWSPDGKRIAFVSNRAGVPDIFLMNADGTEVQQLTKKSGGCTNLRWSPDGKHIAFVGPKAGVDQIHTVEVETGKITQHTGTQTANRQPAWSPDGKKLSYSSYAGRYSTYTMNADGSDKKKLNDDNGGLDAAWSPDGKQLAFTAIFGEPQGWKVYTINADGKNTKQLTKSTNNYGNVYPQWSPDGSKISYGDLVENVLQVKVMNADGSGTKTITSTHQHAYARWSPDGKSISYTRFEKGKPAALFVTDADGENTKELITNVGAPAAEWKPK